jgi:hypothetical protein
MATLGLARTQESLPATHASQRQPRSDHRRYLGAMLRNPRHIAWPPALAIVVMPLAGWSFSLLVIGLQLLSFLVLPRVAWFRRRIDQDAAVRAQQEAVSLRAGVLAGVGEPHRMCFLQLEAMVDEISSRVERADAPGDDGDCFGLRWLLSSYLGVATSYQAARRQLSMTRRDALVDEIEVLRATVREAPRLQSLREQRLAIAEQRLARWERTADELECLSQQLAAIEAAIRLAHEEAAAADIDSAAAQPHALVADLAQRGPILEEIAGLRRGHESIDPRVLSTREAPATNTPSPPPLPSLVALPARRG